jgi:acetyl-CoA synthetase
LTAFEPPATPGRTYDEIRRRFEWRLPARFNVGAACVRHPRDRLALLHVPPTGEPRRFTFGDLDGLTNRVANLLRAGLGLEPGDRVAVALPQVPEAALVHLGAFKAGMISMPLSVLFGPDAVDYRLSDSGAKVLVTDAASIERLEDVVGAVSSVLVIDEDAPARPGTRSFWGMLRDASETIRAPDTRADDPCLLIYTSGTTGSPKGVLHAQRVLIGQAPGFHLCHEGMPQDGDLMWTPADWAWIGGLVNTLLLTWLYGVPIIAAPRRRFDPEWALQLMARHGVRNTFLPTTALRMMLQCEIPPALHLRTMLAGGEAQEPELLERAQNAFGIPFNESYGQTEADFVVGQCASRWPLRPGSMGRAYPGHDVRIMGEDGELAAPGAVGEVPTALLEYWNRPRETEEKFHGHWLRTGDLARLDDDGYFWFESRADDVIKSAGYRIGPEEIEECLRRHEAVANAAVVGAPDPVRGHVVAAFVELQNGTVQSDELRQELQDHVRRHLAAYQYPRMIEFLDALPLTATGKVTRSALRERAAERAAAETSHR